MWVVLKSNDKYPSIEHTKKCDCGGRGLHMSQGMVTSPKTGRRQEGFFFREYRRSVTLPELLFFRGLLVPITAKEFISVI
jgi:hypothetical protein